MLNEILNALVKLLKDETGTQARELLTAVAAGGDLPYGTAIAELIKQQSIVDSADLDQIVKLLLALLGGKSTTTNKPDAAKCADCPYYCAGAKALPAACSAPTVSEKSSLEFDIDRAPVTQPILLAAPDAAAAAEDALLERIRTLTAG